MADVVYGLTNAGFVTKPQSVSQSEIESSLQGVFGQNINLAPESNFGQFVGIMSEREALIWQVAEAVYASQTVGGAEGTSVDNLLALTNLRRLEASPTRTNPTPVKQSNGITLNGLVLYGTPGTPIPAETTLLTSASPPLQFTTDSAVTIGAAVNAVQSLFMSNLPNVGVFALSFPGGLVTPSIPFNVMAQATQIVFASAPTTGGFTLVIGGVATNTIAYNATPAQVQAAINAISIYSSVTVSGNYVINWGSLISEPIVTVGTNSTGVTMKVIDSLQAVVNNLGIDFAAVVVSQNASGFNFTFAGVAKPQPLITVSANSLQNGNTFTNLNVVNTTVGSVAQAVVSATCTVDGPNFVAAGSINTLGTSITGLTGVTNQLDCISGRALETDTEAMKRRTANLQSQANGPLQAIEEKVRAVENVVTAIGFENTNEAALQVVTFPVVPTSGNFQFILNGKVTSMLSFNVTAAQMQAAIRAISGYESTLVTGDILSGFTVDFNGAFGGQPQNIIQLLSNSTGTAINIAFGRPGKSFEIVADGGADADIAQSIFASKPAGIQPYGSTTNIVYDSNNNPFKIGFSRPTQVPIYIAVQMVVDATIFNPQSISTIQQDLVTIGNEFGIGGLVIGFGTNGLIGAFNDVPGILSYSLYFGRSANPTTNSNIQMQAQETPIFESFNVSVSYSL